MNEVTYKDLCQQLAYELGLDLSETVDDEGGFSVIKIKTPVGTVRKLTWSDTNMYLCGWRDHARADRRQS